jgi:hypothetical protein
MSAISEVTGYGGGMAFATTRWSMVMQAQGDSPTADAALEQLCRTYWRPLYDFVRGKGAGYRERRQRSRHHEIQG